MFDISKYEMQLIEKEEEYKEKQMEEIEERIDRDLEFWAEEYATLYGADLDAFIAKAVKDEKAKRMAKAEAELDKKISDYIAKKLAEAETEE